MNIIVDMASILQLIRERYSVRKIGVFGSFSRGDEKKDSDIDVLVEFKDISFDNYMGLHQFLEDRYGRKIDLVTHEALNIRLKPYILKEVKWFET